MTKQSYDTENVLFFLHFFFTLQLINETRIFIVPSVNPDGREQASEKQCTSTQGQANSNGVDLDRDFFG